MNRTIKFSDRTLGWLSAAGVFCIWSGFIVFSRAGVQSGLTPFDVTALRFLVASGLIAPFVFSWWPHHLPLHAKLLMSVFGPGALYSVLMYYGLGEASAAYAGVFANGSLPVFTMVLAYLFGRALPTSRELFAVLVIVVGSVCVGMPGLMTGSANVISGVALFLAASAVISIYIFGVKRWQVAPREALALVTIPNAALFLPAWILFFPSQISTAQWSTLLFHGLFQGIGPGFLAVIWFAMSARTLGPTPTAGLAAAVPASATLLAIPVLGETPVGVEWAGIASVTAGLILLLVQPSGSKRTGH